MYSHMPSDLTTSSCLMHETYASRDWISVRLGTYLISVKSFYVILNLHQLSLIFLAKGFSLFQSKYHPDMWSP